MSRHLLLLIVAMSACGDGGGANDAAIAVDLSAVDDAAVPDLAYDDEAKPADLAPVCANPNDHPADMAHGDLAWNLCAGTPLANTCAASFFSTFASCFAPAGHCQLQPHNFGTGGQWANGAHYITLGEPDAALWEAEYQQGATTCLASYVSSIAPSLTHYCASGETCTNDQDVDAGTYDPEGGALYDETSGVFTCPDGTEVTIGPDLGSCPALNALLKPTWMCDFCDPP